LLFFATSCATLPRPRETSWKPERKLLETRFISNQENTVFRVRKVGETAWREVGRGKFIKTALEPKCPYEIEARPPGYKAKLHTISESLDEVRFDFMKEDMDPTWRPPQTVKPPGL
jgi:hypothetical protein